jgi:hypothetical protein
LHPNYTALHYFWQLMETDINGNCAS